ncbi:MAG: transporter substrate-binding domain-containing protein [Desulfamplus sp.]|nr:transporter substrate-binding domain-containing protein [Desulfamplus sp.]
MHNHIFFYNYKIFSCCLYIFIVFISLTAYPASAFHHNSSRVILALTDEETEFIKEHPVIRVSNELDWPPFDFAVSGQPFGLSIDLINMLARRLGIELQFINGYNWSELVEMFQKGDIDVLQSAYWTRDREQYGLFTKPYFRDKTVFIVSRYARPVVSIGQLKGKIVASPKGWAYEEFLSKHYPDINILIVKNMEDAFRAIADGKADAAIELSAVARFMFEKHYFDSLKITGWFEEYDMGAKKQLHILVRKDMPLLQAMFDKALASLAPGELIELEKKWLGYRNIYPSQKITLTPEEKAFIQENPIVRVANELDWPPFDYVENGKPSGFVMDYISLLGEMVDLKFTFINGYSWPQLLEMGKRKEIDLFPGIWKTAEREEYLIFTPPYMKLVKVLVGTDDRLEKFSSITQMEGYRIAAPEGYATTELVMDEYPGPDYVLVKNNEDGLNQLSMGKVDAFIGTLGGINHAIRKNFIQGIKVIMEIELSRDLPLQMAVRDDWPILDKILRKAMENVTSSQYQSLFEKWIGTIEGFASIESLTAAEKLYLEQKKEICVCIQNPDNPPYEQAVEGGSYEGIIAGYYKAIFKKMGVKLKWVVVENQESAAEEIKNGKCDLLSMVHGSEIKDILLTTPYVEYPLVIATDSGSLFITSLDNITDQEIGIVENSIFHDDIVKKYPAIKFVNVESVPRGLGMLQRGELFGFIHTLPEIGHHIQNRRMFDIKISGEISHRVEFRSGVHKNNGILLGIMEKAIHSLSAEEKNNLFHNWIRVTYEKGVNHDLLWQSGLVFSFIVAFFIYRHISINRYNRKLFTLNREFAQANRKLEAISYLDGLTKIPNRRRFDDVLEKEWHRCERNQHYLTLIMLDIDYFKLYNDRYGHLMGDDCLKKVAEAINLVPGRSSDFVARYGGEEFGIILPDTDMNGAKAVAKRVLSDIEKLKIPHEDSLISDYISVSLGVASVVPSNLMFPRQLVDFADQLLYQAKEGGRNRYEFLILE